jgi:response regulator RpfG family c-di-GMP phosphodiesterase
MKAMKPKLLCVDDEIQVLEGLALNLRRGYTVCTAASAAAGLEALEHEGPFAVVISDLRMPFMDGTEFLARVRAVAPDTVRMLLTGNADVESAIAAVNHGQIFRFLRKPCPPDELRMAIDAAAEQYRLVTAERVLLEETLHGSIKTLIDILAMTNPLVFGRATRIKNHVAELAREIGLPCRWQVEVAAMLSQLGSISLPEETVDRLHYGKELSAEEQAMLARMPRVTDDLLANIPRLEPVREILAAQGLPFRGGLSAREAPTGGNVLKIAADFDELESRGFGMAEALDTMRGRTDSYDPGILEAFIRLKGARGERQEIREIHVSALRIGMVFAEDVRTRAGVLLVARGYEVAPSFMARMRNFPANLVKEPLRVVVTPVRSPGSPLPQSGPV